VYKNYKSTPILVRGDLEVPHTLPNAFKRLQIDIVLECDSIGDLRTSRDPDEVNWTGTIALLEAAKIAKVSHFVYFSLITQKGGSTSLQNIMTKFEERLALSNMTYTIYQIPGFYETVLLSYMYAIAGGEPVWLPKEDYPIPYTTVSDTAKIVADCLTSSSFYGMVKNKTFKIVGKESWSNEQIITICVNFYKQISPGTNVEIKYVSRNVLRLLSQISYGLDLVPSLDLSSGSEGAPVPENSKHVSKIRELKRTLTPLSKISSWKS
jgi:hypothetical protein